ncbi:phosphate butyryltransferase [Lederbergia citrea]|uniref:Phosphate butyryltransferase n=1 Tax=Lederbergia citrea TaxID=2833581 RepID=A0A942UM86_9BACI|nr:phosphate butyryltransferase [Lederbergia citrea]MBS4222367.1 phosphate butyryltransferase [Lederbergia citrea]
MKLDKILEKSVNTNATVAIAAAEDPELLRVVAEAAERNMANFILFGNHDALEAIIDSHRPWLKNSGKIQIFHAVDSTDAAKLAVESVKNKKADILMKGNVPTATLLKAVLHKELGLRTGRVLSHVAVFEVEGYDRLITVTDAAMNLQPNLEQKQQIIHNAVQIVKSIGVDIPKVSLIAAVEVVNPAMQATLDAAVLTQMNRRGQITGCNIDGPLALDNAISIHAAKQKGIESDVAGKADILLVPNIESGNVLYKSLIYFANAKVGAIIAGAKAPIVLTSRADSAESKVYSLALAICAAQNKQS